MKTLLFENEYDLPENEHVGRPDFHVNGVARILVLTQAKLGNGLVQTEYLRSLKVTQVWGSNACQKSGK